MEANRLAFKTMVLRGKRKRSVAANVCLSIYRFPRKMNFDSADVFGGVVGEQNTLNSAKNGFVDIVRYRWR